MSANATQTGWKVTINGYVCPNKRAYVSNKGLLLIVFYQLALKMICLKERHTVLIITYIITILEFKATETSIKFAGTHRFPSYM